MPATVHRILLYGCIARCRNARTRPDNRDSLHTVEISYTAGNMVIEGHSRSRTTNRCRLRLMIVDVIDVRKKN